MSTATKQQIDKSDSEFLLLNVHEHEHDHDHESNGVSSSKPIMMISDPDDMESLTAHAPNDASDKNNIIDNNIGCVSNGNEIDRTIDL